MAEWGLKNRKSGVTHPSEVVLPLNIIKTSVLSLFTYRFNDLSKYTINSNFRMRNLFLHSCGKEITIKTLKSKWNKRRLSQWSRIKMPGINLNFKWINLYLSIYKSSIIYQRGNVEFVKNCVGTLIAIWNNTVFDPYLLLTSI